MVTAEVSLRDVASGKYSIDTLDPHERIDAHSANPVQTDRKLPSERTRAHPGRPHHGVRSQPLTIVETARRSRLPP